MVMRKKYKYLIGDMDVKAHAPIFFVCLQDYMERLKKINLIAPNEMVSIVEIAGIIEKFGITHGKYLAYEESMLNNEPFKMGTIFHLCMSNMCQKNLSWESFLTMKFMLEKSATSGKISMSPDSTIINMFGIDPSILPKSFLLKTNQADEYIKASKLIHDLSKEIKPYDLFKSYDEYFDYALGEASKIIKKCHDSFFYGTHEEDRLACILISLRNSLPVFDSLYKVIDNRFREVPFNMDTDSMVDIQKKLFENIERLNSDNDDSNNGDDDGK